MYGAIGADKAQMRGRERSKSSGSSLQVERGDRRRKEDTSKDKCQMREKWLLSQKGERRKRERKRSKLYYVSRRAAERVCVEWDNTRKRRKKDRDWERHEMC